MPYTRLVIGALAALLAIPLGAQTLTIVHINVGQGRGSKMERGWPTLLSHVHRIGNP